MERLKWLASLAVRKAQSGERPVLNLENVLPGMAATTGTLDTAVAGDLLAFEPGDVLFSKLRPYLSKSLLVEEPMFGTGEFLTMRPTDRLDSRFLLYVTLSAPWLAWANMGSYGAKMPRTSWETMGDFRMEWPSLEEQRRIVAFLDEQVSLLDQIAMRREQQVSLIEDRRWGVFLETVVGAPSVPLRRVVKFMTDGPFGSAFTSADYVDAGPLAIRLGNIGFAEYKSESEVFIPDEIWQKFPRCHVYPGDLLVASLGDPNNHAGRACVAPDLGPALVKGKVFCVRVDDRLASAEYLAMMLSSPLGADLIAVETRGATRGMINLEILRSTALPMPSREQQSEIVDRTRREWQSGVHLAGLMGEHADRIKERKQALIAAAVNGQFDVTTAKSAA